MSIQLKSEKDLELLRVSGKILAQALKLLAEESKIGVTLRFLDEKAHDFINRMGAKPAFLGYKPAGAKKAYPASICTSLNDVVVHGLPSSYALQDGDILKIDIGVNYKGYFTDAAITVPIGNASESAKKLIEVTRRSLDRGLAECRSYGHLGDIGAAIETEVEKAGFSVVSGLTGHGVGFELHEEPTIYNYGEKGTGIEIKPGMVFAIEPMVAIGSGDVKQIKDDSFVTKDGSLTAHFEHTVAITENGVEILTKE